MKKDITNYNLSRNETNLEEIALLSIFKASTFKFVEIKYELIHFILKCEIECAFKVNLFSHYSRALNKIKINMENYVKKKYVSD